MALFDAIARENDIHFGSVKTEVTGVTEVTRPKSLENSGYKPQGSEVTGVTAPESLTNSSSSPGKHSHGDDDLAPFLLQSIENAGAYLTFWPAVCKYLEQLIPPHQYRELEAAYQRNSQSGAQGASTNLDHWQQLAASSLTDMDVGALDDALFLFALRTVQRASLEELAGVRERHFRHWKQRLPEEAYRIVDRIFQQRMETAMNQNLFQRSRANEEAP